jgi:hypothetical protein
MLDPGAMGTLLIGLDAIKADQLADRERRARHPVRGGHGAWRVVIARALRGAAAALDRPALGEIAR